MSAACGAGGSVPGDCGADDWGAGDWGAGVCGAGVCGASVARTATRAANGMGSVWTGGPDSPSPGYNRCMPRADQLARFVRRCGVATSAAFIFGCAASRDEGAPQSTTLTVEPAPPPRLESSLAALGRTARGERFELENARLFVPEGFVLPADGVVPLCVHFQGGTTIAEENFVRSGASGVLLASTLAGLSSAFSKPYADPAAFHALLASAEARLSTADVAVRCAPLTITFFSAGYGAVRELLKDPAHFARIDALVSVDSIYADVVAPDARAPRIEQMLDFLRFAQAAARGEKVFVLAHGRGATPYASTGECADLVLASVGVPRAPSSRFTERGVPIAAEAHVRGFHLYTFDEGGASQEAHARIHMDCLYMVPELVRVHVPSE
jgi:hypothetical protein